MGGLYIMDAQFWHTGRYKCVVEAADTALENYADLTVLGELMNSHLYRNVHHENVHTAMFL